MRIERPAMGAPPFRSAPTADSAEAVALLLAGLLGEAPAAARLGVGVEDLRSLLEHLGLDRAAPVPVRIEGRSSVRYLDVRGASFRASLFDDVVDDLLRQPGALQFRVPLAEVLRAGRDATRRDLGGVILHSGRSGSTLLCNLLASLDGWVVLQEPELLNTLLRELEAAGDGEDRDRRSALVALLLHSLARGASRGAADGRRCAVKLTSWNAILATELLRTDPVPLVALVREPWASVESLLQDPPYWHTPPKEAGARMEATRRFAVTWSRTVEGLLRLPGERTIVLSYDQLTVDPVNVLGRVSRHFGGDLRGLEGDEVGTIARAYSKGPVGEPYEPQGRHARRQLDGAERNLVTSLTAATWEAALDRIAVSPDGPAQDSALLSRPS